MEINKYIFEEKTSNIFLDLVLNFQRLFDETDL